MIRRLVFVCALAACDARSDAAAPITAAASVRGHALDLEIAADPDARDRGLMFRRELAENAGLLLVFPDSERRAFSMRNVYVPLSIAYLDDGGRITAVDDLSPFDETLHWSPEPARYAVEVPYGWFTAHGVGPDDVVSLTLPAGLVAR